MHSKAPEFTTINLFWSDPYNFLDGQILAKVIITLLYSANLLFGTILLLAIIYHEKYGEDPQKRSTLNQVNLKAQNFQHQHSSYFFPAFVSNVLDRAYPLLDHIPIATLEDEHWPG